MEAGAPTPSLTPSIIDYARLQISSEKEPKTRRQREREREGEKSQKEPRTWNEARFLRGGCHLGAAADAEPSPGAKTTITTTTTAAATV